MSFHYDSWVIVWFSSDHFWFSPSTRTLYHIMIFTNSWKSRLPSPSLSAALINIITSSSVSTSPGGWLWASKTKSSWKQRQGQRQRTIQKQRQKQRQRQILTNVSHEVFELSGLHGAAAIFVEGAERQSHLVVMVVNFSCMDAVLLVIFLTCFASMLYCYIGRPAKIMIPQMTTFLTASLSSEAFILWLIMLQNSGNSIWPEPSVSYCRGSRNEVPLIASLSISCVF